MRTTLTLDPDVAERLKKETATGRVSLKAVVNERLRIGFGIRADASRAPFKVEAHHYGLQPGVDPLRLNQCADELEAELHSNDTDFSRFKGLRWRNPLKTTR